MGTLSYLAVPRLERIARQVRSDLATLRQHRLILLATNDQPVRNPDLDPLLDQLCVLRVDYDLQISELEAGKGAGPMEMPVLARAREILADVTELTDLLVWLGAKMHIETDSTPILQVAQDRIGAARTLR